MEELQLFNCLVEISEKCRRSVEVFRDYKFLGTRNRVDGTVGE